MVFAWRLRKNHANPSQ